MSSNKAQPLYQARDNKTTLENVNDFLLVCISTHLNSYFLRNRLFELF